MNIINFNSGMLIGLTFDRDVSIRCTPMAERSSTKIVSSHQVVSPLTGKVVPLPQHEILGVARSVSDFEKLNRVGEGTYGIVYRARDMKSDEIVALKKIRMDREKEGV